MKLPGQLQAEFALKGIWLAAIALVGIILFGIATVQTVRLNGFNLWPISIEGALPAKERLTRELGSCENRLATSNASISRLEGALAEIAERAEVEEQELNRRRDQAEREADRLARQAERSQRRIDELNRIATEAGESCAVPDELLEQLEGL